MDSRPAVTDAEHAAELEAFALEVEQLRGVSRTRPHAFAEGKSELAGRMRRRAIELRTIRRMPDDAGAAGTFQPRMLTLRGRRIPVEVRASRRA